MDTVSVTPLGNLSIVSLI